MARFSAFAVCVLLLGSCFDDKVAITDVTTAAGGPVVVTVFAVDATASESGDPGTFAVSRAGDSSQPLTVTFTVGGTATEGVDFAALGTSVVIPAGAQIAFLTVAPIDDKIIEPNETVVVTVTAGTGYTVGSPASATVTIVDDDGPDPVITVSAVDANASESGIAGSFALLRAGEASAPLTVNITLGGTATNGTDYTLIPSTVLIPAGAFVVIVPVTPIADSLVEGDESVILTVAAGTGYSVGAPSAATVTISDGPPPSYSTPETPAGTAGVDNAALAADLGSDGQPRLVYRRGTNDGSSNTQIRLVARRANGTWTAPVLVSANNFDFKNNVFAVVSRNNNFTHVFWIQTPPGSPSLSLHYAQFDAGDPPTATIPDIIISSGPVTGLSVGAAFGNVSSFAGVIDRATNNVAAVWVQTVTDGSTADIPIAGLVTGGSGAFGDRFALVIPPASAGVGAPIIRAGPGGVLHVLYGSAVHRMRTGPATWTTADGAGFGSVKDLVIAPDGDAYAVVSGSPLTAAYRPAGAASTFGTPQALPISSVGMTTPKVVAVLEPGTEHLHAFVLDTSALAQAPQAAVHAAPNLSGSWTSVVLHNQIASASFDSAGGDFVAFANQSNEVTVVFRAPLESGDLFGAILSRSRPSGVASVYAPIVDLTAAGAFPALELVAGQNTLGNAIVSWRQGNLGTLPGEIYAQRRSSGTWATAADNVSRSPALPSHGPLIVLLGDAGAEHVFWDEQTTAGGLSDVYYAHRP